jgi:hypothetical protein
MDDLLEQRQQTHGDFTDVALVAQATKDIWRAGQDGKTCHQSSVRGSK